MSIDEDFEKIMNHAHYWNWGPDWKVIQNIYEMFPQSYSVLTPFTYAYLEELIRSTTSEYGIEICDNEGKPKRRKVGLRLIELAITENSTNKPEYTAYLEQIKSYYKTSSSSDIGDNRNSVAHGYMHPRFWDKKSFEKLIHDIALLSRYTEF